MILFYKNLFYLIYRFFKKIEAGFAYQTDWNRAIEVVFVISIFELLNVLSFFPASENNDGEFWVPYILLLALNAMIFLVSGRYKKIVSQFLLKSPSSINNVLVGLYLIGTILTFIFTR
jgi:hypothetical protein